ncbi:hypothetical protein [Moritella sp. Urea-trap-13]|uniref:hypothetical protein n=1 Tax=Moritella sp. Urea-trap-13 TaxID=2058327 RepID=UPI000C323C0C|nr:hypothetical protein [Moritella sp. Urea-trap-13]PKH07922.1 hypothetical protein CXF93_04320 [Moritella sp. Urea-trap-13]
MQNALITQLALSVLLVSFGCYADNTIQYQYKVGAEVKRDPEIVNSDQEKEDGGYVELGVRVYGNIDEDWHYYSDVRAFAANSQIRTFDNNDTGRTTQTSDTDNYLHLRQLWFSFSGLSQYPNEALSIGLQKVKSSSALWWDTQIESVVWNVYSTKSHVQVGVGQRFDTYRSNNELSELDKNRTRLFIDSGYDWKAYHTVFARFMFTHQDNSNLTSNVETGAPDGANGDWLWFGLGLGSNWIDRRSRSPWAYNVEFISLTGESDFVGNQGQTFNDQAIKAWAIDAGIRYDFKQFPFSIGMAYSQGSGGFDSGESNMFVQTGLHTNRSKFVGNDQSFYRYGEALRPDLTNLIYTNIFAAYSFTNGVQVATSFAHLQRDDVMYSIYRNSEPLEMNKTSNDVGYGGDVAIKHNLKDKQFFIPINYWQLRLSRFQPGDAFNSDADKTVYRVALEMVGVF